MLKAGHIRTLLVGLLCVSVASACGTSQPTAEPPTVDPPRDEIYVAVDGKGDYATLEEAVAAAEREATIALGPGIYRLVMGLEINKPMTLIGAGMDKTEIVSGAPGHVLNFSGSGSFVAEGITFRHDGTQAADVVVIDQGRGDFSQCRFVGAVYEEGQGNRAGLRYRGSSRGTVEDSLVLENDNGGILVENQAQPELRRNICSDNGMVGIGYMDLARGVASENECTRNAIGIAVAVEARPTLEGNQCNDNEYGIAYLDNGGGESYGNECLRNRIGIAIGGSSTVELGENDCRENSEEDIRDFR